MSAAVAILIPAMRPHRLASVVGTIAESTNDYRTIVIATGECANVARELPVTLLEDDGGTWPQRINRGYKISDEPYIFTGADDIAFRSGWFDAAMRVMSEIDGVVAVNDLNNANGVHFLISRNYIETLGGVINQPGVVMNEEYRHAYCDDFCRSTAIFHNRWAKADDAIVEHLHAGAGKSPHDEIYALGESTMSEGFALYQSHAHLWIKP